MSRANLPRQQSLAVSKMEAFAASVSPDPARYGLTGDDAEALQAAVDDLSAAYAAGNPQTNRTRVDVAVKERAFVAAEAQFRRCYSLVKWNDVVPDPVKAEVGVRPVNRERTPVVLADTFPLLKIVQTTVCGHKIAYADNQTPESRRKPRGATQLQLFVAVGDAAVRDPAEARLIGCFTRSPAEVRLNHSDEGKRATYFGRWVSQRGQVSRYSSPIDARIAG